MPAKKGKGCVGAEMSKWKAGQLHSGVGKEGKEGPVVKDKKQAIAIALSVCGKSDYAEHLRTLGFSEEASKKAAELLFNQTNQPDWDKNFLTGDTGAKTPRENKTTIAPSLPGMDIDNRPGKQKGSQGKHKEHQGSQVIAPVTIPKGNPQQGPRSRSDLTGLAAFEESNDLTGECNQREKREQRQRERTPDQQQADQQRSAEMAGQEVAPNADRQAAAQKAAETRKKCKDSGGGSRARERTPTTNSSGAGSGASGSSNSGAGGGAGSGAGGGAAS